MDLINYYLLYFGSEYFSLSSQSIAYPVTRSLMLLISVALLHWITTKTVTPAIRYMISKIRLPIASYLLKHNFFLNVFRLFPIVLIQYFSYIIGSETIEALFAKSTSILLIGSCSVLIFCILDSIYDILEHRNVTRNAPIKSLWQLLKVVTVIVTLIMIISAFIGKSPAYLLSGLGALSAVLLIVFKDPLVNFFAGVQITSQRLVKVGDWVEIEGVVDGTVISINMVNCTIRGWKNQTHTVSLSKLLESKNWRDMPTLGRHIRRTFYIDADCVKFLDIDEITQLSQYDLLKPYVDKKLAEQPNWGEKGINSTKNPINSRQLTNIGMFRAFIKAYMHAHEKINEHSTILVRQLNPTEHGIPMQIYAFTKPEYSGWQETEELASDIIDWTFAISKRFDITIYQRPSQLGLSKAFKQEPFQTAPPITSLSEDLNIKEA